MKCVSCGSASLVKGTLMENGGAGTVVFKPDEVSVWKTMFGVGTRKIRVYGCIDCQHLQLAVDFSEEDLRRYQQLEGEQMAIPERMN